MEDVKYELDLKDPELNDNEFIQSLLQETEEEERQKERDVEARKRRMREFCERLLQHGYRMMRLHDFAELAKQHDIGWHWAKGSGGMSLFPLIRQYAPDPEAPIRYMDPPCDEVEHIPRSHVSMSNGRIRRASWDHIPQTKNPVSITFGIDAYNLH